jgi:hypothetical protein
LAIALVIAVVGGFVSSPICYVVPMHPHVQDQFLIANEWQL